MVLWTCSTLSLFWVSYFSTHVWWNTNFFNLSTFRNFPFLAILLKKAGKLSYQGPKRSILWQIRPNGWSYCIFKIKFLSNSKIKSVPHLNVHFMNKVNIHTGLWIRWNFKSKRVNAYETICLKSLTKAINAIN